MPLTPQQLAELQRLKELMRPQAEEFTRRMQAVANAEKGSGQGVSLPTDRKAKGGLAEFLKDSKVKHRVYHTTNKDFTSFDPNADERGNSMMFFSDEPFHHPDKEQTISMPVHIQVKKIFDARKSIPKATVDWIKKHSDLIHKELSDYNNDRGLGFAENYFDPSKPLDPNKYIKRLKSSDWQAIEAVPSLVKHLKSTGHDAIKAYEEGLNTYGLFDPNRIKSAIGNRGTYDTTKADITKAKGGAIHLKRLGKFHDGEDPLAAHIPERANAKYALHPDKWESTFFSLTNKDPRKLNYYGPEHMDVPEGTLVGDMVHANRFYRAKTDEEKLKHAKAYRDSLKPYPIDLSGYRMPELLMPQKKDITKATGGSIPSQDVMRLAIGGQGPKNWLKGSVENVIKPLINQEPRDKSTMAMREQLAASPTLPEDQKADYRRQLEQMKHAEAVNQWVERNLANYIRKQMATHDDPIRKLAEQGIVHMPPEQMGYGSSQAEAVRKKHGAPRLGQSPEAQAWEDAADVSMHKVPVKHLLEHKDIGIRYGTKHIEPWMEKADPQTQVYMPLDNMHAHYLGFDHLVDILKQDLAEGRIRPEQLSKVSIEHAVRRAHEYDQERKKAMAQTALKATEGMPVHKEYPEGYKWIELALPKELPEGYSQTQAGTYVDPEGNQSIHHPNYAKLDDALKYEGDTMGHCVGGYTPDVASGKSRIFSLRDAKNEPHVTIEVKPNSIQEGIRNLPDEERFALAKEVKDKYFGGVMPHVRDEDKYWDLMDKHYVAKHGMPAPRINQIKGKQNAKPKKDYIPYVQDFVRSGNWSDIKDLQNTDLYKIDKNFLGFTSAFIPESEDIKHLKRPQREEALMKAIEAGDLPASGYATRPEWEGAIRKHGRPTKGEMLDDLVNQLKPDNKAHGGEVDAEEVFMGKGGKVKELEQYLRDREGEYGLKRLQRAADEIPGLENMYTLQALKEAFGGDNAKALMTMNPADFEKFAVRLFPDPDTREEEMEERIERGHGLPPMSHHEYIKHLAKIKGGFADVPFLEVNKRPEYLPNISGHEGRHRSRAMMVKGAQKSLVRLLPSPSMRESMPRRNRENFIEAMKKELGEKRLVTGEGRSLLPADLEAPEHKNIERRNMLGGRPQLPEIYKDGGDVDVESYFFPNKE